MSDPSCRTYRELLGVYVVGAIDPAERAWVDAHLAQCYECREELAGLALLPALMHRVPVAEAEAIARPGPAAEDGRPSGEMLTGLLAKVAARRRTRRVRSAFAVAAAVLIAAGGAAAAAQALAPGQPAARTFEVTSVRQHGIGVTVRYGARKGWGVAMWVRASGLPEWSRCRFYVVTADGQRTLAGGWLVGPGGGRMWYPAQARVPESGVTAFVLVTNGRQLVRVPAT